MKAKWQNLLALGIAIGCGSIASAQTGPAFEVSPARVGAHGPGNNGVRVSRTPQRLAFQASLVGDIVAFAYEFPLDRVERRPQWMYDNCYNVAVTTAAPTSLPEQRLMLQKLLEERFGLVVHRVSNETTVYYLVAGAKVNLMESKEAGDIPEFRMNPFQGAGFQPGSGGGVVRIARHVSMSDLAAWLYPTLGLPVLDKTGLTGFFDMEIPGTPGRADAEKIIRAARKTLGLDLELHPGTAESLIIDHSEEPSRN